MAYIGTFIPILKSFVYMDVEMIRSTETAFFVPLGISYYSMSLIGYLADVYWKKEEAERNYFKLLLFAIYFPKILEGPISKHRFVSDSMYGGTPFAYKRFCFGLQRMLWGYFKKLVIADRLSIMTSNILGNYNNFGGSELLVSAVLSAIGLYCDFSGCMDIALGASDLFGIKMEENFNHPFFSKSVAEFWRRWHISLGTWVKDYIYMPLVTNSCLISLSGIIRNKFGKRTSKAFYTGIPLFTVWLLTGLWHGTGINYVVWGMYWGVLIIISNLYEKELKMIPQILKINKETNWYKQIQIIRTFLFFVISRIITVPSSLQDTFNILYRILCVNEPWHLVNGDLYTRGMNQSNFVVVFLAILILFFVDKLQMNGVKLRETIASYSLPIRWGIYIMGIVVVTVFGVYGPGYDSSSFVYMFY